MSDDATEARDDVRAAINRHDITADQLRAIADDLHVVADKWEATEDVL